MSRRARVNEDGTKNCLECKQSFPATDEFFYRNNTTRPGGWTGVSYVAQCKPCWKRKGLLRKQATRVRLAGSSPSNCEACGHAIKIDQRKGSDGCGLGDAAWDHNHSTGQFRGWLCGNCNRALGFAGDNPKILDALAEYLRSRGYGQKRPLIR